MPDVGLFSSGGLQLRNSLAKSILDMDLMMSNAIAMLSLAHTCMFVARDKCNEQDRAKALFLLQKALRAAKAWLNDADLEIQEAALKKSVPTCSKWCDCVAEVEAHMEAMLSGAMVARLDVCRSFLEKLCPQWGEAINDHDFKDDSAQLILGKNGDIVAIPGAVKSLEKHLDDINNTMSIMGISNAAAHHLTRDSMHLAGNALRFARRTVSVAAATKIVLSSSPDPAFAGKCIDRMKNTLPQALLSRLALIASSGKDSKIVGKSPAGKRPKVSLGDSLQAAIHGDENDGAPDRGDGHSAAASSASSGKRARLA